jgi:hypothetical protein
MFKLSSDESLCEPSRHGRSASMADRRDGASASRWLSYFDAGDGGFVAHHQRKGLAVHGAEGPAVVSRRRLDRPEPQWGRQHSASTARPRRLCGTSREWLARLVASAKGHARKAGRPFELTTEFIENLFARQKGRCDVIGRQFNQLHFPDALVKHHPFARRASIGGRRAAGIRRMTCGSCVLQSQDHGNRAARSA